MKSKLVLLLIGLTIYAATNSAGQQYKLALPGYQYEFPRDYFNHEEYQTEWWYYTGNLRAADGHRFGFELTFFRQGESRAASSDPWFVDDLWMAHLALSDVTGQRFYHEERLNRAGPGIAGVDAAESLVWNGNWQAHIGGEDEELRGVAAQFGLILKLRSAKPPVVHGQNGVSQKSEGTGRASHYFSLTRLQTSGSIELAGRSYSVEGSSWMDHEFFTSSMATEETGWDWLSVQFDDGSELMLYRLRHRNGSIDPCSSGTYVDPQGRSTFLANRDFSLTPSGDNWTSAQTKATYPERWRVSIPKLQVQFEVTTPQRAQELVTTYGPSYWEGTIAVTGTRGSATLHGQGYLEMTGYAAPGESVIPP
jgi:predicted secreted hydrolase